ncbi:hypothetical protein ANAEL_04589 [Anaerolineales bacterium]|nr:hypothetical protein ANAEL_04589 [Anaerolineales bacterium]
MKTISVNGKDYRLSGGLNHFQQEMQIHLIDWKWEHITHEPGTARGEIYDAILPEKYADRFPILYPDIIPMLREHLKIHPFRIHIFFNHMASSQAANINLFLPILQHPNASAILSKFKPDFSALASAQMDHGYRIEFWDEPFGNLNDKTPVSGTDSDIAIAYYNHQGELCLWLIEHKLTESEFTTCGGFRSKGRQPRHNCSKSFSSILADKHACYYHDARGFNYWKITDANQGFFPNHGDHAQCPFQGGMNQLWRNQLLALSIEQDERQPYRHVTFSVVRHPRNTYLDETLIAYQNLIANNPKFSVFTSADVIDAASSFGDDQLEQWVSWYKNLYAV